MTATEAIHVPITGNVALGRLVRAEILARRIESVQASSHVDLKAIEGMTLEQLKAELTRHDAVRNEAEMNLKAAIQEAIEVAEHELAMKRRRRRVEEAALLLALLLLFRKSIAKSYQTAANRLAPPTIAHTAVSTKQALAYAQTRVPLLTPFAKSIVNLVAETQKAGDQGSVIEQLTGDVDRVAATESQSIYGNAQMRALTVRGFTHKQWLTMEDDKVRKSHMLCGEQGAIKLNSRFTNGLLYPGDPDGGPEEVCNCRCYLLPVRRANA